MSRQAHGSVFPQLWSLTVQDALLVHTVNQSSHMWFNYHQSLQIKCPVGREDGVYNQRKELEIRAVTDYRLLWPIRPLEPWVTFHVDPGDSDASGRWGPLFIRGCVAGMHDGEPAGRGVLIRLCWWWEQSCLAEIIMRASKSNASVQQEPSLSEVHAEEEVSSHHRGDQKDRWGSEHGLVSGTAETWTTIETSETLKDSLKSVVRATHL